METFNKYEYIKNIIEANRLFSTDPVLVSQLKT
jgi:hypothetical protein